VSLRRLLPGGGSDDRLAKCRYGRRVVEAPVLVGYRVEPDDSQTCGPSTSASADRPNQRGPACPGPHRAEPVRTRDRGRTKGLAARHFAARQTRADCAASP